MIHYKYHQKAFFSLRFFIYVFFIGFFVYCGFWVGRFYYDYYAIHDAARNIFLEAHRKSDEQILTALKKTISLHGTPIYNEDIKIIRKPGLINLKIEYSEYLFIGELPLHKFNFSINETRQFKK